jgi:hypothetical protein
MTISPALPPSPACSTPAHRPTLAATVDQLLAEVPTVETETQPKALIVPHAGYIYSGATAAMAYAALSPRRTSIHRVILLGPTHRVAVNGWRCPKPRPSPRRSAIFGSTRQPSPNRRFAANRLQRPRARRGTFAGSASALPAARPRQLHLVPLAVGHASPQAVAEVLDLLWGGPETLIVISSDLSHFLPYADANRIDRDTCQHILHLDTHIQPEQACGAYPVNGLLLAAQPARSGAAVDLSLQFRRHGRRQTTRRRLRRLRLL